jgi:uncharacterized protein DUF3788
MSLSAFREKNRPPSDDDLRAVLGKTYASWRKLIDLVGARIEPITQLWGFTSASTGWGLRLRHKERVILYMTPQKGQFLVSFALGEKAVTAARAARLSPAILNAIAVAPTYAEGRGVRIVVKNSRAIPALAALAQIKWES